MRKLRRVRPGAVTIAPMDPQWPVGLCSTCGTAMLGYGRLGVLVDGGAPCSDCRPRLLGAEVDQFASDYLEQLAARIASLPRGAQRQTAARLLLAAAQLLAVEYGGPVLAAALRPAAGDVDHEHPAATAAA